MAQLLTAGNFTNNVNYFGIHVLDLDGLSGPEACYERCVEYNSKTPTLKIPCGFSAIHH